MKQNWRLGVPIVVSDKRGFLDQVRGGLMLRFSRKINFSLFVSRLKSLSLNALLSYLVFSQVGFVSVFAQSYTGKLPLEPIAEIDLSEITESHFVLVDGGTGTRLGLSRGLTESTVNFRERPGYTNFRFFDVRVGSGQMLKTRLREVEGKSFLSIEYEKRGARYSGSRHMIEAPKAEFTAVAEDTNLSFALDADGILYATNKDDFRDRFGKFYPRLFPLFKVKNLKLESRYLLQIYKGPLSLQGLQIDDAFMQADLENEAVRTGALLVIEEQPDGSKRLVDLYSRRNILTSLLGKEHLLTSLILQLKPGGTSDEYIAYLRSIAALQVEIGEHALAQGDRATQFEERLQSTLASFEGTGSVQAIGSVITQIRNDEGARAKSVAEMLDQSSLILSPLSRDILSRALKSESIDEIVLKAMTDLIEGAKASPDSRTGEFAAALEHAIIRYDEFMARSSQGSVDELVGQIFTSQFASDIAEWVSVNPGDLPSETVSLVRVLADLRGQSGNDWKPVNYLLAGALAELRQSLDEFANNNPIVKNRDEGSFAVEFEQLLTKVQKLDRVASEQGLHKLLGELRTLLENEAPTVGLADLLNYAKAHESRNQDYQDYVKEARLIPQNQTSFARRMLSNPKLKAVTGYLNSFRDIPHGIMAALFLTTGAFLVFGENEAFQNATGFLTQAVPVWGKADYVPELLSSLTHQIGIYLTIHAGISLGASIARKPVGWFYNNTGKDIFKWLCFPFLGFGLQKIAGQSNVIYSARQGVWPSPQRPSWASSQERQERARRRAVDRVNESDFLLSTAQRFSAISAIELIAAEAGLDLSDVPPHEMRDRWERHRMQRYADLMETLTAKLKAVRESGSKDEVARQIFENEERRVQELEKVLTENARMKRLAEVTRRRLRSVLRSSNEYDFSSLSLNDEQEQRIFKTARHYGFAYASSAAFIIWMGDIVGSIGDLMNDQLPRWLNYPLDSFEELQRVVPKTNVGQTTLSAWQGDMLTQYIILGFHNGTPFVEEFSEGGKFAEEGFFVRGNITTPQHLLGQDMAMITAEDGSISFSETEAAPLYMANTHPQEMVSLMQQNFGYWWEINATNLTEVASGSRVADFYAKEVEIPAHERNEGFWSSLKGLSWSMLHVREYGVQSHIRNKFKNIFKFFQPRFMLFSACVFVFLGGNPFAALGTFFLFSGLKYFAYAWPWSPLYLGADHRSDRLAEKYARFAKLREELIEAREAGNLTLARLKVTDLADVYEEAGKSFRIMDEVRSKGASQLSLEDIIKIEEHILKQPAYHRYMSEGLEKFIGFVAGGIPTTVMAISFFILTLSIVDPWIKFGLGVAGLAGFAVVDRGAWLYDKIMKASGMDRRIRQGRMAKRMARAEALGAAATSREFLQDQLEKENKLTAAFEKGEISQRDYEQALAELDDQSKFFAESIDTASTPQKRPGLFNRCALFLKNYSKLSPAR